MILPTSTPHTRLITLYVLMLNQINYQMAGRVVSNINKNFTAILEKHWTPAVPRAPKGNNIVVDYAKVLLRRRYHARGSCIGVFERTGLTRESAPLKSFSQGCWITDIHGRKFLDFQTGIGVASTGHCHPRFVTQAAALRCGLTHDPMALGLLPLNVTIYCSNDCSWQGGASRTRASCQGYPFAAKLRDLAADRGAH